MHSRTKALLCACTGFLCIALTYQFGARNAGAQAGGMFAAVGVSGNGAYAVLGRTVYFIPGSAPGQGPYALSEPLPGVARAIAVGSGGEGTTVVLEDGSVYSWSSNPHTGWHYRAS